MYISVIVKSVHCYNIKCALKIINCFSQEVEKLNFKNQYDRNLYFNIMKNSELLFSFIQVIF
jgi:hypothetical protein